MAAFQVSDCDNIREVFTGANSTTITKGGAAQNARAFSAKYSSGDTFWGVARAGAEIAVGLMTDNGTTIAQTTIFYSSNGGSPVTFSSGNAGEIYVDVPGRIFDTLNLLEATVLSAATTDIGASQGLFVALSGTTGPITSFGTSKNKLRIVRHSGSVIVHDITKIILLGAKNRTTVSGDIGVYQSDNSTPIWREIIYQPATPPREYLAADRTYYVRTDGSNSNNGLANTSGGAFLTAQKAMDVVAQTLDLQGYTVTVQIADGTYTGGVQIKTWVGGGVIVFQGNSGTPANVFFDVTGAAAFDASFGILPGIVRIKDLKTRTATSGFHIVSRSPGRLQFTNIVFSTAPVAHVVCTGGGLIEPYGSYSIIGAAGFHFITDAGGTIINTALDLPSAPGTVTLTGTPAFTTFAFAQGKSTMMVSGITFSGAGTGVRYSIIENSLIRVGGAAAYFPVNNVGTTATGGQYT